MNIWLSSIVAPSYGRLFTIAGPPVLNSKRCPPTSAEASSAVRPAFRVKLQRTPAGRSRSKSYTQFFMSAQRPLPFSMQSIANGSTSRGSPKGTIGRANRAVTWRTALTSPCGEKNSTSCACSADGPSTNAANTETGMRSRREAIFFGSCGMRILESLSGAQLHPSTDHGCGAHLSTTRAAAACQRRARIRANRGAHRAEDRRFATADRR